MKRLFIAALPLFILAGCSNSVNSATVPKVEDNNTALSSFDSIDPAQIATTGSVEADFLYNPYDIEDLLTKFNQPEDVEVMEVTFNTKDDTVLTDDGSLFTPYKVSVDKTYNPQSKINEGDEITIYNSGGCVTVADFQPFIQKEEWLEDIGKETTEWKNSNYYCEDSFAQTQDIGYGDSFLVMTVDTTLDNTVVLGNGLMEIEGNVLINNDDTSDENLSLEDTRKQILQIYE